MNKSLLTNIFSIALIAVGYISPVYSEEIKTMGLYSFSGAITNWLAIHMLFEKVPGLYGSGIITQRFEEFKVGIEKLIMTQFFTKENLDKFLTGGKAPIIDAQSILAVVDFDQVFFKLKSAILESPFGGMLGMFGGEQALDPLKPQFKVKFEEVLVDIVENPDFTQKLAAQSDLGGDLLIKVEKVVKERLNELTPIMVKEIINDMIREHLGWLVIWGGVFGALIGLVTTFLS